MMRISKPIFSVVVILTCFNLLSSKNSAAQENDISYGKTLSILGTLSGIGRARGVAVSGKYAYIATTVGLVIADISDSSNPREIARRSLPGVGYDIELKGKYAYVACRSAGVYIVDISTPTNPVVVGMHDTIEYATGLALADNLLFVACRGAGLEIVDISNPLKPEHLSSIWTPEAQGVAVRGNYCFVGNHYSKSISIIDISNPRKPKRISEVRNLQGNGWGVVLKDNYAYAATGHGGHGAQVIDISDIYNPVVIGGIKTPPFYLVGPDSWEVAISGNYLFLADGLNGIFVFDIKEPGKLKPVARSDTPGYAHNLAVGPGRIYVADYKNGLHIIDATGLAGQQLVDVGKMPDIPPRLPSVESSDTYQSSGQIRTLDIRGDYAFLAAGAAGMEIISLSPSLKKVGAIDTPGIVLDIKVSGNIAYLGDGSRGLVAVDVTDVNNPKLLGRYKKKNIMVRMLNVFGDKVLAVTNDWGKMELIDMSDPAKPIQRGSVTVPHFANFIADTLLSDRYAVVSNALGLQILDINNPGGLSLVASIPHKPVGDVAVWSHYVMAITKYGKGLKIFDLSNLKEPVEVAELGLQGGRIITIRKNRAYIQGGSSVKVIDISDPENPRVVQTFSVNGRLIFDNNTFYQASGFRYEGLKIEKINR